MNPAPFCLGGGFILYYGRFKTYRSGKSSILNSSVPIPLLQQPPTFCCFSFIFPSFFCWGVFKATQTLHHFTVSMYH